MNNDKYENDNYETWQLWKRKTRKGTTWQLSLLEKKTLETDNSEKDASEKIILKRKYLKKDNSEKQKLANGNFDKETPDKW